MTPLIKFLVVEISLEKREIRARKECVSVLPIPRGRSNIRLHIQKKYMVNFKSTCNERENKHQNKNNNITFIHMLRHRFQIIRFLTLHFTILSTNVDMILIYIDIG